MALRPFQGGWHTRLVFSPRQRRPDQPLARHMIADLQDRPQRRFEPSCMSRRAQRLDPISMPSPLPVDQQQRPQSACNLAITETRKVTRRLDQEPVALIERQQRCWSAPTATVELSITHLMRAISTRPSDASATNFRNARIMSSNCHCASRCIAGQTGPIFGILNVLIAAVVLERYSTVEGCLRICACTIVMI
jgi:hypothetical protein